MIFSRTNSRQRRHRPGFTLLELTLVMALLVIVGAVSWPSFEGWFQSHRLREGVDALRTHWVKARTLAMEEGRPYRFAWELDSGNYRLAPADLEHWPDLADSGAGVSFSMGVVGQGLDVEESLPEGIAFRAENGAAGGGGWAADAVFFWPDGTARIYTVEGIERPDITVWLADRRGQMTALHLRGLTGVVRVYHNVGARVP